jgi:hypothetical protein
MNKSAALLLAALPAGAAWAQAPAGSEFQVHTITAQTQDQPMVAIAPDGGFLAVWRTIDADSEVAAQLRSARGVGVGAEYRVNGDTTGHQQPVALVTIRRQGYLVVWSGPDGDGLGVRARRIDRAGAPVGQEFLVNTVTAGIQQPRAAAAGPDGAFVIAWESPGAAGGFDVMARRYGPDALPRGAEFRVNTGTGLHVDADVAVTPGGGFVAAWTARDAVVPGQVVLARRFAPDGAPLGGEFVVEPSTAGPPGSPVVAADAAGAFVVAWSGSDGSFRSIQARRYDAAGSPRGAPFRVNTDTAGTPLAPTLAGTPDGGFTVFWDEVPTEVRGRRYGRSGLPRGPVFQANSYATGVQFQSHVASDASGNLVATWTSEFQDGDSLGVFGQRFGGLRPASLAVDAQAGPKSDGNSVLEACETVAVAPAWRNDTGAAQMFTSAAGSFSGPPGATYAVVDAGADYGVVADDDQGTCADGSDCLAVSVSCASPRPATHWDAFLVEEIVPEEQGQTQRWALHLGDSFSDVPRSSPFYRFVETVLHRGVTGGCDATRFCPAAATTRGQMAVFLLLAREGAGYAPPPCGTPVFPDVPASSAFCPWVEELARRGVVGGCGGGSYCPAAAVTREQMAVFVLRTLDGSIVPPACTTPVFADVPASSPFCRWIEELARRGVVAGCGGGNYCPVAPVTREQVSAVLTTAFGLALHGP